MAYALFEEVNAERKAIEDDARAREVANQRNEIYQGVQSDTTWFPGVSASIAGRVDYFTEQADQWIQLGRATILESESLLENSFQRFEDNSLNGYSSDKMHYAG